jgi:subtilisin family serine protease
MTSRFKRIAWLAATALTAWGGVQAQDSVPATAVERPQLWFVELQGAPAADGRSMAAVQAEKATFRAAAAVAGLQLRERRSFDTLFNGFVMQLSAVERTRITLVPGFKAAYPVQIVHAPAPDEASGSAPDLVAAITLTRANVAQDVLGLTGRGIKVGIIDTGIDIDHPAFGGGGVNGGTAFPTARVTHGWDFVGDDFDSSGDTPAQLTPQPDANPDDCNGHGTHVAGIVGGHGAGIKGVAPDVTFGAYRVFGCDGTTTSDIILAALERAHADGMHVINQSLGASRQWPQYPTAQASSRLARKGVVMVASIGNSGPGGSTPDGLFAAGAPGVGSHVIGVASFDNAQRSFRVNGVPYGYNAAAGAPLPPTSGSLPMAKTGTTTTANDGCNPLAAGSLSGRAALIRRGTCSFFQKATNAQNAGAAAVVLYNNAAGALNPTVAGMPPITIPVVAITAAQGAVLDANIAAGATVLNWGADYVAYPFGTGGLISGFSSFGLAADLSLKPDLGGPGGAIFSSYPLELGGAATLSGTSMSSPHVAGIAAQMLQADPRLRPDAILRRLQGTAQPKLWAGNPGLGFLDHVHRQGGGMVDAVAAVQTQFEAFPHRITLFDDDPRYEKAVVIQLKNNSRHWTDWTISHEPALTTGPNTQSGPSYTPSGIFADAATVTLSNTSVTIAPRGATGLVSVSFASPVAVPDRSIYGGYIVFRSSTGDVIRVPYAGMKGDYQSTQVITPTPNGFPWLAQLAPCSPGLPDLCFFNRPAGQSYTMAGDDIPYMVAHLDHLSRRLKIEAIDAVTGRNWGSIALEQYMTRNSTPGGAFIFAWDGTTFRGNGTQAGQYRTVPNGQYVMRLSILKALGEDDLIWVPEHSESWTSPVVTVARP